MKKFGCSAYQSMVLSASRSYGGFEDGGAHLLYTSQTISFVVRPASVVLVKLCSELLLLLRIMGQFFKTIFKKRFFSSTRRGVGGVGICLLAPSSSIKLHKIMAPAPHAWAQQITKDLFLLNLVPGLACIVPPLLQLSRLLAKQIIVFL